MGKSGLISHSMLNIWEIEILSNQEENIMLNKNHIKNQFDRCSNVFEKRSIYFIFFELTKLYFYIIYRPMELVFMFLKIFYDECIKGILYQIYLYILTVLEIPMYTIFAIIIIYRKCTNNESD